MGNTFANREVCDLIFEDYATKTPFLNMDYANVSTTEITGESVFAYGGKGHQNAWHSPVKEAAH